MRIAGIIRDSVVNGNGIRDVVFVQGCPHHCEDCHNPNTWKYDGGMEISPKELASQFKDSPNNITISGGEPFAQWEAIVSFMYYVREYNPNKQFWIYTGYTYDEIKWYVENYMTAYVSVIVDGRFVKSLKDPKCLYCGSSNQRLIDVPKTIKEKQIVLWEGNIDE